MTRTIIWTALCFGVAGARAQVPAAENVMNVLPGAVKVTAVANFVTPDMIAYTKVLAAPPAAGSSEAAADLAAVKQVQATRTEADVAWAKLVDRDVVYNNASVVGAWFTAERLPRAAEFFKKLGDDFRAIDGAAKKPFLRARPMTVDASVTPCVGLPTSTSYPSGSAMQAWVWAELLAEALPAKADALRARAERAAWGRVIGGVHFPSDVAAGRVLAGAVVAECRKNPEFRTLWAAVRGEIAGVSAKEGAK